MNDIDWSQKRRVFYEPNSGEYWVKVEAGFMLDTDYIEGGRIELPKIKTDSWEDLGKFTNAQIDQGAYLKDQPESEDDDTYDEQAFEGVDY